MNENYKFTEEVKELLNFAIQKAIQYRHEILTPEHFLYAVLRDDYRELGELNLRSDLLDGKFCQLEIFLDWKLLEEKLNLTSITVMVQKEVAERIASKEGNKAYGILVNMNGKINALNDTAKNISKLKVNVIFD